MRFTFAESAKQDFVELPKKIKEGLKNKFVYWQGSKSPLDLAKPLSQHAEATHRFRFGAYRVLVKRAGEELRVLRIRHRREVYNK